MSDLEIEIQVKVANIQPFIEFLKSKAKFKGEYFQQDDYYSPAHKDFLRSRPVKEWLRIRKSDGRGLITYKNYYYNKKGKSQHYAKEYNVKIDNPALARKLFHALNFRHLVTVKKQRRTWDYQNYLICIDHVRGLGDFIEIEYKGRQSIKPQVIVRRMVEFLKKFKIGPIERNNVGYPFMLLFPKEVVWERL